MLAEPSIITDSQPASVTVRYRDGIEIELSDGTRVVCDADRPDGDVNVDTHAHGDHYPDDEATALRRNQAALGDF